MNILICTWSLQIGGAERQAFYLAEYFRNKGDNVTVLGLDNKGNAIPYLESIGVRWLFYPFYLYEEKMKLLMEFFKLLFFIRKLKPDVILPFTYLPNVVLNFIWKFTGAKLCVWNQRDIGRNFRNRRVEKFALKHTKYFISNSLQGKDFLVNKLSVTENKIKIINNGVKVLSPIYSRQQYREKYGIAPTDFVAIKVANLTDAKDHLTVIKAWKTISNQLPYAKLLLCGSKGNKYTDVYELCCKLELLDSIVFLDFVKDIAGINITADIAIFSSKLEGSPNGIIENMSYSLPVVASDIAGNRYILGDEYPFYFPVGDDGKLAYQVIELYNNYKLRSSIGLQNKNTIETKFGIDSMTTSYQTLINQYTKQK